ncbi:hypothetical protein AVEN_198890-1 [Araneus ventricosus]|uniref:Retrotransposon gag domain-containing protein n=1 Tax=Araneus ventricosus TaxID=182803 RepID=A0A4Y2LRR9_ARAVE|nr:hypothetical protein AVEN_198890-1 [Araneus ventricosus]
MENPAPPPPLKLNSNHVESWKQRFQLYMDATSLNAKAESQKRNITYERQKLFLRVQREGQSVDDFITELRKQLRNRDYGSPSDSVLVDQLVRGLPESRLRERLLRVPDLDIKKAVDMSRAAEISKLQAQVYFTEERSINVIKRFKPSLEVKPRDTSQANKFRQPAKDKKVAEENVSTVGAITFQVDVQLMLNSAGVAGSRINFLVLVNQNPSTGYAKIVQRNLPIQQIAVSIHPNNSLLVL